MKRQHILFSLTGIVAVTVLASGVWLYTGKFTAAKMQVFSKLPLPAALIDNYPVSGKELMVRYSFAKSYLKGQPVDQSQLLNNIYQQYLDQKKLELVAKHVGVTVTPEELESQYQLILQEQAKGDEAALSQVLEESYGITLSDFKNKVLYIEQLQINLTTWYNGQKSYNKDAYAKANELLKSITDEKNFADVAKAYTQDENGKAFDGDAGFLSSQDLLPEFKTQVEQTETGKPFLVASRYGLHIINVMEKTGQGSDTKYHIQQIFLKTTNVQDWLKQEMELIKTTNLRSF